MLRRRERHRQGSASERGRRRMGRVQRSSHVSQEARHDQGGLMKKKKERGFMFIHRGSDTDINSSSLLADKNLPLGPVQATRFCSGFSGRAMGIRSGGLPRKGVKDDQAKGAASTST